MTKPLHVKWVVSDGIPESEERVRNCAAGIEAMRDYLASLGVPHLRRGITVYVMSDPDELTEAYDSIAGADGWSSPEWRDHRRERWKRVGALAVKGRILVNLSNECPGSRQWPGHFLTKVVAHELFHVYQGESSGSDLSLPPGEVPGTGPQWLMEGAAEFSAIRALWRQNLIPREVERSLHAWFSWRADRLGLQLRASETLAGMMAADPTYSYALLGANALASLAGEEALMRYYTLLPPRWEWPRAFAAAFGITIEGFYARLGG